ncbi:MAG: hypothetical protein PHF86_06640 [Candidatus Nanoarchaeia archaeon]|jgi:hypothetical protein|nr:hypothetical protein [Candidatus Nanoarchaeia archaeon]
MFWLKSKKLEGDDLVNAVKTLQDSATSRKDKTRVFDDLRETFGGLIGKKMKQVSELASNAKEREEIRHHIESSFLEVLMELTPKSAGEIVGYIAKAFGTKINRHSIAEMLGKGEVIPDVGKYKIRFKNALRTFFQKNKRMPDFNKIDLSQLDDENADYESKDLKEFSEILKTDVDKTLEILKLFGQGTIKSMYEEVSGDEGESALLLMDTLKSNEPLPDEVLRNKEIMRLFMEEIKKLPDNEKKVLLKYYHPDDPGADDLTSNEVAKELGKEDPAFTERMVRHWIAIGREKLRESPKLKELYTASMINKLVKIAMLRYRTTEDIIFEVVASYNNG